MDKEQINSDMTQAAMYSALAEELENVMGAVKQKITKDYLLKYVKDYVRISTFEYEDFADVCQWAAIQAEKELNGMLYELQKKLDVLADGFADDAKLELFREEDDDGSDYAYEKKRDERMGL